jgi:hypothetical protein
MGYISRNNNDCIPKIYLQTTHRPRIEYYMLPNIYEHRILLWTVDVLYPYP